VPTWRYLLGQIWSCTACLMLWLAKPLLFCVVQRPLSLAIFCVCFKHFCLLLSSVCVSSTSVSCYLSCVSQACLSLVIWKVGQPTLPSCMHTVVFAAFAFTCKQKSHQSRQFLSRIKPDTRLTLYKLTFKHGARDCLSV